MAYQNFFAAKLTADIGASDVSIAVDIAPTTTAGRMVLEARNPTQREIIRYTGVAGNTLTGVTRGLGGTSAKPHTKNSLIEQNLTAEDLQDLYDAFTSFTAVNTDWRNLPYTTTITASNGNRSYNVQVAGVDLTSTLSAGMRLRFTKSTATQVQCSSLNGTTQYWSRASGSVAGLTFTDDFVVSAWVKLTSLPASFGCIASRSNGANGFQFGVDNTGAVALKGFNAGAGNVSQVASYQSTPLNRWVEITGQLDMSAFTATTTTSYVMLDGVDVPSIVSRSGTNPTALVQTGNLEIGSLNSGTFFFPGKIAQVAIYSAKVTQATIKASMNQSLTGSETSIAAAYKFDGNGNDLTANGNNLTANGSVVATDTDSPFGNSGAHATREYAVIMSKPVYAASNTTFTVSVPEGCILPTSGSIASLDYTGVAVPVGFPKDKNKWDVKSIYRNLQSQAASTAYADIKRQLAIPAGAWDVSYDMSMYSDRGNLQIYANSTLSTASATTETNPEATMRSGLEFSGLGAANMYMRPFMHAQFAENTSVITQYYLLVKADTAAGNIGDDGSTTKIVARNAYI